MFKFAVALFWCVTEVNFSLISQQPLRTLTWKGLFEIFELLRFIREGIMKTLKRRGQCQFKAVKVFPHYD
jgi:hypothetical protein